MRVSVHFNLRTKLWVMSHIKLNRAGEEIRNKDKGGIINNQVTRLTLSDVHFVVPNAKTAARVLRQIQDKSSSAGREVNAYAVGTLVDTYQEVSGDQVSFNPEKANHFYIADSLAPCQEHYDLVSFTNTKKVYAI